MTLTTMFASWRKQWTEADAKSRALAIVSALAVAFLVVAGGALLVQWAPLVELFALWGAPAWAASLAGATVLALAVLLAIDDTAFYAALVVAIGAGVTAFAWARESTLVLALMPAIVCVLAALVMALRSDVPKVHFERATRRRKLAHT